MPDMKSRSIQWAMWANECCLFGALSMCLGGIIGLVGGLVEGFLFWFPVGIYGIVFGLLIFTLEYARGKKFSGKSIPRRNQNTLSNFNDKFSFLKNYYARSTIYLMVSIPAGLIAPTFLGTAGVLAGAGIYIGAAANGETWQPIKEASRPAEQPNFPPRLEPPSQPPPRLPTQL